MNLSPRDRATILAALRCYQASLDGRPAFRDDIEDLASNGGELKPLSSREVSDLCERINAERAP